MFGRLTLGYPSGDDERALHPQRQEGGTRSRNSSPSSRPTTSTALQARVPQITSTRPSSTTCSRSSTHAKHPGSRARRFDPRSAGVFFTACQALALVSGRDFVVPDDVKRLAAPVLSHRVVLHDRRVSAGDFAPETRLIEKILSEVPVRGRRWCPRIRVQRRRTVDARRRGVPGLSQSSSASLRSTPATTRSISGSRSCSVG